jgi:hypothetical protein
MGDVIVAFGGLYQLRSVKQQQAYRWRANYLVSAHKNILHTNVISPEYPNNKKAGATSFGLTEEIVPTLKPHSWFEVANISD